MSSPLTYSVYLCCAGVSTREVRRLSFQHHLPVLPSWQLQLLLGCTNLQDLPAWHLCSRSRVIVL